MSTKIGIVGTNNDGIFGVKANYMEWIFQFGIPTIISPGSLDHFKEIYKLDALVLPGGLDVDPRRYNERPSIFAGRQDPFFEHFDNNILPNIKGLMPIFGICRGLQTLNVLYGGTLRQHLYGHKISNHDTDLVNDITTVEKGAIRKYKVNSFHHQAIKELAPNFITIAKSTDDVIEAILDKENKLAAVQYHPERMDDDVLSKNLFNSILG